MIETDSSDGVIGNLGYLEAVHGYDNGRAKTRAYEVGLSWFYGPSFRISLGVSDLWGDKPKSARPFRSNPLSRVSNASGETAKSQFEQNNQLQQALGQSSIDMDDFSGTAAHQKQVWIRSEFKY